MRLLFSGLAEYKMHNKEGIIVAVRGTKRDVVESAAEYKKSTKFERETN